MSSEIMQETTTLVECSAFHRGMSVLEASLRNTEDLESVLDEKVDVWYNEGNDEISERTQYEGSCLSVMAISAAAPWPSS